LINTSCSATHSPKSAKLNCVRVVSCVVCVCVCVCDALVVCEHEEREREE
jgi:hypothetical protein